MEIVRGVAEGQGRDGSARRFERVVNKHLMGLEKDVVKRCSGNWLDSGGEASG